MLRGEIAAPLGVADELHFGVPRHLLTRVARAGPDGAAPPRAKPGSPLDRAIPAGVQPTAAFVNRHDTLAADIPSQGTMTARAAARMYAALLGHIEGVRLVSPKGLQTIAAPAFSGIDQVMDFPTSQLPGRSATAPHAWAAHSRVRARPSGWSVPTARAAYADIDSGVAVAVMRNHTSSDFSVVIAIDDIIAAHHR